MANNHQKHTKVYRDAHKIGDEEIKMCEYCRMRPASEVHHIEYRSKFGKKTKDEQDRFENLIGLCRLDHEKAHKGEITKEELLQRKIYPLGYEN